MSTLQVLESDSQRNREGFTLLEVMLALGLATLLLAALGTAIEVHLNCVQVSRTHVEEAQLARALLHRIGDDLRNAAIINPVDATKIAPAPSSNTTESATTPPGDTAASSSDEAAVAEELDTEDEYVVGLYGESDWMQVDVRRTPRLDQYDYETLPSGSEILPDLVSGVKTVYYGLSEETGLASSSGEYRGGLIRREIDRAATSWADEMGTLNSVNLELDPIAPEVTDLELLYYDGAAWVDTWDSTEMGGLPIAVHVSLSIMPRGELERFTDTRTSQVEPTVNFIYSLTVALPVAEGDTSEEAEETTEEMPEEGL